MFIFAQILGGIALLILILSFQKNEKQTLLKYQIGSSVFFAAQYLCLQAYSGCLINIACIIRNILFRKYTGKKIPIYYLIFIICIMIVLSLFSYVGPISLLGPCGEYHLEFILVRDVQDFYDLLIGHGFVGI